MKKFIKHILALLISAVCIYIAFRNVEFNQALQIFSHERVHLLPIAAFTFLCLAVMWIRAWRWRYLFLAEHRAGSSGLTTANLIGFMSNNILPFRIGEMVRAWMARRKTRASLSYVIATLFVERLFDTLSLLLCLILPVFFTPELPGVIRKIGLAMSGVFLGALILLLLLRSKPHLAQKMISSPLRPFLSLQTFEKLEAVLHTFTEGLRVLRNGPVMLKVTLLSLFHWGAVLYSYHLALIGFSFTGLHWTAPMLTLGLVGMGVALPSAPAFVGPIHYAIIYSLSEIYGVPKSEATGFAVVMHLLMMGPITIVGLAMMWREGLSLQLIRRKAEDVEENLPLEGGAGELPIESPNR